MCAAAFIKPCSYYKLMPPFLLSTLPPPFVFLQSIKMAHLQSQPHTQKSWALSKFSAISLRPIKPGHNRVCFNFIFASIFYFKFALFSKHTYQQQFIPRSIHSSTKSLFRFCSSSSHFERGQLNMKPLPIKKYQGLPIWYDESQRGIQIATKLKNAHFLTAGIVFSIGFRFFFSNLRVKFRGRVPLLRKTLPWAVTVYRRLTWRVPPKTTILQMSYWQWS